MLKIKQSTIFLILLLILFNVRNVNATYWNELTYEQQDIVIKYKAAYQSAISLVENMESSLFIASDLDRDGAQRADNFFRIMPYDYFEDVFIIPKNLNILLETISFPNPRQKHIKEVFNMLETNLRTSWEPLSIEYKNLQKKSTAITQEEADSLRLRIIESKEKLKDFFPSDIETSKVILFPDYLGRQRILPLEYLEIKKEIEEEFEKRKKLDHTETVMSYGSVIAPAYFQKISRLLPLLVKLKEDFAQPSKTNILSFEKKLLEERVFELNDQEKNNANLAVTNAEEFDSEFEMAKTQLKPGEVWSLTYRLIRHIYEEDPSNNEAKNLVYMYFIKLAEQGKNCTAGGVGRNFQILFAAYEYLIKKYNK